MAVVGIEKCAAAGNISRVVPASAQCCESSQPRGSWDRRRETQGNICPGANVLLLFLPPPVFAGVLRPRPWCWCTLVYPSPTAHRAMLEVRNLFTEAGVLNSVPYNKQPTSTQMKCQQWTRLSVESKHTKLNKSTGPLPNDPLQSPSLKKFHLKVLKNVRVLIMCWEHRATPPSFQPAASGKTLLWKVS